MKLCVVCKTIISCMGKVKVCIVLREDLWVGFRSRGLTNLSGAVEEFLSAFLSSLPTEYKRRSVKETRELIRRFLEGKPVQENTPQEFLQQLITLLQTLPLQTSQPQQETHQETLPPTQPEPTTQEPKQTNPQKPKQKTRKKPKQN
jgi:outer membrane biosynthesis protein TonB